MAPTICLPELPVRGSSSGAIGSLCSRRRQRDVRNNNNVVQVKERDRVEIRRIFDTATSPDRVGSALSPPASPVWEPTCPTNSPFIRARYSTISSYDDMGESTDCGRRWRSILARREGLLDIVARTMALVRRSHVLQKRVNALRYETREFIRSVLNNPENNSAGKHLRDIKIARGVLVGGCEEAMDVSSSSSSSSSSSYSYSSSSFSSFSEVLSSRPITPPPTPDSSTECVPCNDESNYNSQSDLSNADYSSDDSERAGYTRVRKLDQDPMVSSS